MYKTYPKSNTEGYTADEIRRGIHWVYTDYTCPHCGKVQPVTAMGSIDGKCVRCGLRPNGVA